jgi:DNA-binding CsgD family transcriptional regulator
MGLRRRDKSPFCGPACPVREHLRQDGSFQRVNLLQERSPGCFEEVELIAFAVSQASGAGPLALNLVVPSAARSGDRPSGANREPGAPDRASCSTASRGDNPPPGPDGPSGDAATGRAPDEPDLSRLTDREKEVLNLLANGYDTKRIAEHLFISPITVKHHVQGVMRKLGVHRRVEAILAWIGSPATAPRRSRAPRQREDPPPRVRSRRPDRGPESPD